jgi:hypothetical protein
MKKQTKTTKSGWGSRDLKRARAILSEYEDTSQGAGLAAKRVVKRLERLIKVYAECEACHES